MSSLITGMSGFVGGHLAALLLARGETVDPLDDQLRCALGRPIDLRDAAAVAELIECIRPTRVYHLAALSNVGAAWKDPSSTSAVNVDGTRNLLEAVRAQAPAARVLIVSSGAVYGPPPSPAAVFRETDAPRPQNPYAASKLAAERIGAEYVDKYGLDVRRVRPLGHTGPGQRLGFVVPDFASQIAAIAAGSAPPRILVGNLAARREFADVRDVVRAYELIMDAGEPGGTYNLATNETHSIGEVAEALMAAVRVRAELVPDPARLRPADESSPRLDTRRLAALGFRHQFPFAQTMADVMKEWLAKAQA
jgi:GDP-4-dehydro-6-deoxy-D-mannose reductase